MGMSCLKMVDDSHSWMAPVAFRMTSPISGVNKKHEVLGRQSQLESGQRP